uniref:Uncharacterized protein n=1 Tax=Moorena producens (strain JHB) TaxID=1454205 RepID=A0A1D9G673_MOOP1
MADIAEVRSQTLALLDAIASGGNHGSRSWGGPPRPRCLPKTALHRLLRFETNVDVLTALATAIADS